MIPITKIRVNALLNLVTITRDKSIKNQYNTSDKRINQLAKVVEKEVNSYHYGVRPLIILASWGWELEW